MLRRIAAALWGKFESREELQKFGILASLFFLIIGTYWTLRPMKDSIFNALVGIDYQPMAKWLSLVLIIPLIIIYSKLIDAFPRHKVFYGLVSVYAALAAFFYFMFSNSTFGLSVATQNPMNLIGWAWYVYVESFGSLVVTLFWAITADTTTPESASRGFPMIALLGQMGNIFGPFILNARFLGLSNSAPIVGICSILMILMALVLGVFMSVTPSSALAGYKGAGAHDDAEQEPGFAEGLKLLLSHGYLLGIFAIITIYEIIITVIDFHFKKSVTVAFNNVEADINSYLASYATMTGVVATVCVLFGISNIQRRLGMTASLITLPLLVGVAVAFIKFHPASITVAFWIMVLSKAINYVLNQPTLKQLYIPTTKSTKYKAQAWSDTFGSRGSKALSSGINMFRKTFTTRMGDLAGAAMFMTMIAGISAGLIVLWLFAAVYTAKAYNKAIKENRVVC